VFSGAAKAASGKAFFPSLAGRVPVPGRVFAEFAKIWFFRGKSVVLRLTYRAPEPIFAVL
jgi:hypothetical protein